MDEISHALCELNKTKSWKNKQINKIKTDTFTRRCDLCAGFYVGGRRLAGVNIKSSLKKVRGVYISLSEETRFYRAQGKKQHRRSPSNRILTFTPLKFTHADGEHRLNRSPNAAPRPLSTLEAAQYQMRHVRCPRHLGARFCLKFFLYTIVLLALDNPLLVHTLHRKQGCHSTCWTHAHLYTPVARASSCTKRPRHTLENETTLSALDLVEIVHGAG